MALKIRLQRGGNKNRPAYRVVVAESAMRRDGRFVEKLGHYVPRSHKNQNHELGLNLERIDYWVSMGAKPTETVATLIKDYRKKATQVAEVPKAPVVAQKPVVAEKKEAPKAPEVEIPKISKIPEVTEAPEASETTEA